MEFYEDEQIFNEDLSGTIYENIDDLPVMSFIDKKIRYNHVFIKMKKPQKNDKEYYKFITKKLNEYISARPEADANLLFRIADMEWQHINAL